MIDLPQTLNHRVAESHKGDYGHALLVAGSYGKMGCAILAAQACLRVGVGLLTVHLPEKGLLPIQTAVPEAMTSIDHDGLLFASQPTSLAKYNALAIGPGIGTADRTYIAMRELLTAWQGKPMVLDADALNIIASHKEELLPLLGHNTILTPHAKEYERMFGGAEAESVAKDIGVVIVKKGHKTKVVSSTGEVYINDTGNPGMATAGSGDVLTGVLLGLLAQGMESYMVAKVGVYIHGKAGDEAVKKQSQSSLLASDLIENLKYVTM